MKRNETNLDVVYLVYCALAVTYAGEFLAVVTVKAVAFSLLYACLAFCHLDTRR